MRSERHALRLLRNVYRSKGTMTWEWGGTCEAPEMGDGAVAILMKCSVCGAISRGMTKTCRSCGRIDRYELCSMRVLNERIRTMRTRVVLSHQKE